MNRGKAITSRMIFSTELMDSFGSASFDRLNCCNSTCADECSTVYVGGGGGEASGKEL